IFVIIVFKGLWIPLGYQNYFNYLEGHQNSRCVSEGEEVLSAANIIFYRCRVKKKDLLEILKMLPEPYRLDMAEATLHEEYPIRLTFLSSLVESKTSLFCM
ncbi:hypothetical protein RN001_005865, partial [Aquatica leii]